MLIEKQVASWKEFEKEMQRLIEYQIDTRVDQMGATYLFRGQANSKWHLETTLDRNVGKNQELQFYFSMISRILPEVETFTNRKWEFKNADDEHVREGPFSGIYYWYEFLTYLRHHGFPSPLLDWTYSPYIAAYFAFRNLSDDADHVAVYAYAPVLDPTWYPRDKPRKSWITPFWHEEGGRTNKRHYLQQSIYTICVSGTKDQFYFADHEELFADKENEADRLTKYIIPASDKGLALMNLEFYNINAFSLLGTEESLLETLFANYMSVHKARTSRYPHLPKRYY